ncbi:MAG: DUF177 domain-containing protein [Bacteroidales bacterium]|nr:DUF177 domain-containing protein [Bacteroidales bacterium]
MNKVSNRGYIIPINGMSIGKHLVDFSIDNEFFEEYDNSQILGALLNVKLELDKSSTLIEIKGNIDGSVTLECDRCLELMEMKLQTDVKLLVKFVKTQDEEDNDEVTTLDPSESELDLSQFLYDYICLALPIQRAHPQGECDPEMIEKINALNKKALDGDDSKSPFDKLKDLMN